MVFTVATVFFARYVNPGIIMYTMGLKNAGARISSEKHGRDRKNHGRYRKKLGPDREKLRRDREK